MVCLSEQIRWPITTVNKMKNFFQNLNPTFIIIIVCKYYVNIQSLHRARKCKHFTVLIATIRVSLYQRTKFLYVTWSALWMHFAVSNDKLRHSWSWNLRWRRKSSFLLTYHLSAHIRWRLTLYTPEVGTLVTRHYRCL